MPWRFDLRRVYVYPAGTFGQVWLVSEDREDGERRPYALKIQTKHDLAVEGQIQAVIQEKNIMAKLRHPVSARAVAPSRSRH